MSPAEYVLSLLVFVAMAVAVVLAMRLGDSEARCEAARERIAHLDAKRRSLVERLEDQVAARWMAEAELIRDRRVHERSLTLVLDELEAVAPRTVA